jgi:hypothetical protein
MAVSKNRKFAQIANDVAVDGTLTAAAISSDVTLGGATIYASRSNLPTAGNTAGDQAFTTDTNRLYIWNGSGWYNVALLNVAPSIQSVTDSDGNSTPFILSTEGAISTITITAQDSDGDPITYTATADSDFSGLATLSQADNVFTVTPFSQDSATTTTGTITFTATDGINVGSSGIQTFTLSFLSEYWDETILSIDTSSTNSLNNSTFIDRSTNALTVTPAGAPYQTSFHPYLDNWSANFTGDGSFLSLATGSDFHFDTGDYTVEAWVNPTDVSGQKWIAGIWSYTSPGNQAWALVLNSGKWRHLIDPADTTINTSTSDAVANVWTHVAIVRDGDAFKLFVNGVLESNVTSAGYNMQEGGGYVGIGQIQNAPVADNWRGQIADLHVIKGYAKYTSNFTPSTELITPHANTVLLTCRRNRFYDESGTSKSISSTGSGVRVAGFSPYGGQLSEYAPGENKGSVYLNGAATYISSSDASLAVGTGDFCIEYWINPSAFDGSGGFQGMIDYRNNSEPSTQILLHMANGQVYFYVNGSNRITGPTLSLNQWYHIALSRESGTSKLFVNGQQVGSDLPDPSNYTSSIIRIGADADGNGPNQEVNGYMSDIRVTVGSAVRTANFTAPTAPVGNTNASLYLPMDNAGIYDKTGNHTLTLVGNTLTSTTQTKFANTAVYFDGTGDYITTTIPGGLGGGDFTIEFWAYHNVLVDYQNWVGSTRGTTGFNVATDASGDVVWYDQAGGAARKIEAIGLISTNTWYHIAFVRSNGIIKAYLDGTAVGSAYSSSTNFSASDFGIGDTIGALGEDLNGYIENLQILRGVAKYTTNFTPPTQTQGRTYQAES